MTFCASWRGREESSEDGLLSIGREMLRNKRGLLPFTAAVLPLTAAVHPFMAALHPFIAAMHPFVAAVLARWVAWHPSLVLVDLVTGAALTPEGADASAHPRGVHPLMALVHLFMALAHPFLALAQPFMAASLTAGGGGAQTSCRCPSRYRRAMLLRAQYAMSGTEIAYGGVSTAHRESQVSDPMLLRARYAKSGTEIARVAYLATRPVCGVRY
eukprot:1287978-Rhodomonas_salina.2